MRDTPDAKWQDDYYVKVYRLARSGMTDRQIAAHLGVTQKTLRRWRKKRPALRKALGQARTKEDQNFFEYVYRQLPDELKTLWDQIRKASKSKTGTSQVEALLEKKGERVRQHLFLHALYHTNFNPSEACRIVNITRRTFDSWKLNDPNFAELVQEFEWHKDNFFDACVVQSARDGDTSIIGQVMKSRLGKRGYADVTKVEGKILHEHSHAHALVSVDELDLPLEVRKQILEAHRKSKQLPEHVEDAEFTVKEKGKKP